MALKHVRGPFLAMNSAADTLSRLERVFHTVYTRKPGTVSVDIFERGARGVLVVSNMDDQPFIVDSMRLFLSRRDAEYSSGFNIVIPVIRNAGGMLTNVGSGGQTESIVMMDADAGTLKTDLDKAALTLKNNLELACAVVRDFRTMTHTVDRWVEKLQAIADSDAGLASDASETAQFLKWLAADHFVFMGMEATNREPAGIQTATGPHSGAPDGDWPSAHAPGTVQVRKSLVESRVHRAGRIDEIRVTLPGDPDTNLFIRGMFTYRAITQPCRQVPILRGVLAGILQNQEAEPGSFRYKGISNVFDSLPTEFLFTATREDIANTVDLVFESEQRQEVGVTFLMTGPFSAFCLIAMPKSSYSEDLRSDLESHVMGSLRSTYSDHGLYVGRFETVLAYFYLTGVKKPNEGGLKALRSELRDIATPWSAQLWHALDAKRDEATADRLTEDYGRAFPDSWMRSTPATRAIKDIDHLEALSAANPLYVDIFEDGDSIALRIYQSKDIYLSDILPVLDAMGLLVLDSYATIVKSAGGRFYMDTFRFRGATGVDRETILSRKDVLIDAIEAVFAGKIGSDGLNRLVLGAGMSWQDIDVLRAYLRYGRQLQVKLSEERAIEMVLRHPVTTQLIIDLFSARFDPDLKRNRKNSMDAANAALVDAQRKINTHDEDLLFRSLRSAVNATVRTNAYRTDKVRHYLSFKFECDNLELMAEPKPVNEIFVSAVDVEGVHLRFGKVARGGLRWSDRDDYRTEVLGLATTQVVKNVLIVPTGAKGGFKLKQADPDPSIRREQADELYKIFIRGLLDVTDNAVNGNIIPPPRVVRHDDDDAYLVVAADKGTAHLSDTANGLAREYGFWLDDAFASGGSNGYDHKKVGITARGAWVLVRRHFAEMGINPYKDEFDCVGIGDMGGDVFGNGLIETDTVRLRAAFNHIHVFLDPNPYVPASAKERKRLFKAGRGGGWENYNTKLISDGGGVYNRASKSIPLSPQAKEMLGIDADEAAPEVVIRHILLMKTHLFWNGGIGTYVKASFETDADADDRSNDSLRVNADQLRCDIIGEGGNLGMTQRARIEAAQHGVRLNTDFVDNSAGVDMSDHEVNLKILLNQVVKRGELDDTARNELLESMTSEVATLVLNNNDLQGRQLSRDAIRSQENIFDFGRAIAFVSLVHNVSRKRLNFPTDAELAHRAEEGVGLTRPELAILSSWVKMYVFQQLMNGNPRELPGYDALLMSYFPKVIQERYADDIRSHMLADEIAMTEATNQIIADAGASFFPVTSEKTGRSVPVAAHAYRAAQQLARTDEVRSTLEELRASVQLSTLNQAWVQIDAGIRHIATYWQGSRERIPTAEEIVEMQAAVNTMWSRQGKEVVKRQADAIANLRDAAISKKVAKGVLKANHLNAALMVWAESKRSGHSQDAVAVTQIAVGRATRLQEVLDHLSARPATGEWDPVALHILYNRFNRLLRELLALVPVAKPRGRADSLVPKLEKGILAPVRAQVDALMQEGTAPSVASLLVLEERVAGAVARMQS
ncbi:MAG: glutamate dehydrogenase [Myxococcota bacterium]